jgi:hypothetical protein
MKKFIIPVMVVCLAALMGILFSSCSDEPDNSGTKETTVSICTVNGSGSYWLNGEKKGELALPVGATFERFNSPRITTSGGKVYILGSYSYSNGTTYCYWVNGVRTNLSLPTAGGDVYYRDFIVSGGKVYISGSYDYYVFNDEYYYRSRRFCYWLDGVRTDLSLPDGNSIYGNSESTISNGRVYVAGAYDLDQDIGGDYEDKPKACYWVDGVRTDLSIPSGNDFSQAYSINVSNGKVYVSGVYGNNHYLEDAYSNRPQKACYWVDGVRTDLSVPAGTEYSTGSNITISNGKVYQAGAYGNYHVFEYEYGSFFNLTQKACYWVNGERTDLSVPAGTEYSAALFLTVSNGKVYANGYFENEYDRTFGYWVNGVRTDLTLKYPDTEISPIWPYLIVSGGKVYISGHSYYYRGIENKEACYWVDGVRTNLNIPDWVERIGYTRFAVSGGKVHIALGDIDRDQGSSYDSSPERAFYFIDGVKQSLPDVNNIAAIALVTE